MKISGNAALIAGIAAVVAILGGSFMISHPCIRFDGKNPPVTVVGESDMEVEAEKIGFSVTLRQRIKSYEELSKGADELEKSSALVRNLLLRMELDEREITFCPIGITEVGELVEGKPTNRIHSIILSRTVKIFSARTGIAGAVAGDFSKALFEKGIIAEVSGFEYFAQNINRLENELIHWAASDGLKRAEDIAQTSKCKLGKLAGTEIGNMICVPVPGERPMIKATMSVKMFFETR